MNTNRAKEFFERCRRVDARIQNALEEQARIRAQGGCSSSSYTELPGGSGVSNKVESAVMRLCALEQLINAEIDELVNMKMQAQSIISQLSDNRHRDILTWRYFDIRPWAQIADALHYDRVHVWRLHRGALSEAQRIIDGGKDATHGYMET